MPIYNMPFPTLLIDPAFEVLEMSNSARQLFGDIHYFSDILDEGSFTKQQRLLSISPGATIEMALDTLDEKHVLFAIGIVWEKEKGFLQCFEIGPKMERILHQVLEHQDRLASIDFELLAQKELAETQLTKIKELSAPVILLTKNVAFVPLFGVIDHDMIHQTKSRLSQELYDQQVVSIIFDFNGVHEITESGVRELLDVIEIVRVMGLVPYITGIKPQHAKLLANRDLDLGTVIPSLQEALRILM
ncbi:STAS domain-containing protein [Paenisporosarcina cavernae]|uniref:STAS domain-containing protein n=1 Tax=Paenisporosarcina cavernae TaxID=2320858 RepID=A0A385YZ80_9BACL|nr:STAS domain-containing protein [Paenisporosarcina cavernae]AYC30662.1 STAS domain-containing protein [Paenisporosarcina cavernae]